VIIPVLLFIDMPAELPLNENVLVPVPPEAVYADELKVVRLVAVKLSLPETVIAALTLRP